MGFDKNRRPILVRPPGSAGTAAGTQDSARFNTMRADNYHYLTIGSASSMGATVGPRGLWMLQTASSAGATSPIVINLASPTSGDVFEFSVLAAAASSNTISLRTSSCGTFIGSTGNEDSLLIAAPGVGGRLVAASSNRWLLLGVPLTTTASGSSAGIALVVSTS